MSRLVRAQGRAHSRKRKALLFSLFTMLMSAVASAQGPSTGSQLVGAIRSFDTAGITQFANGPSRTPETSIAQGVLASLQGNDENALRLLQASVTSSGIQAELRFEAWRALADVYRRTGRFRDAVTASEAGLALGVNQDALDAQAYSDTLAMDRALASLPPMQADVNRLDDADIVRNALRLPESILFMNGQRTKAALDTDAPLSLVTESAARRLGLRLLDSAGKPLTFSAARATARYALADTLKFAGGDFRDVPFIVLADDALSFAEGSGVEVILGTPVLRRLGRLEFAVTEAGERFRRRLTKPGRLQSNMIFSASMPVVLVRVDGATAPLRLALDSGAMRSVLTPLGASEFPELLTGATAQPNRASASGGTAAGSETTVVPRLVLKIGEEQVRLLNISISGLVSGIPAACHGIIGQDVLRSRAGYVVDFDSMRLELLSLGGGSTATFRSR